MKKKFHLTRVGIDKLRTELRQLQTRRKEVAKKLEVAYEHGDLNENAEYQTARDEQVQVESRVAEIQHILENADVIDNSSKNTTVVDMGNTVVLKHSLRSMSYTIVGSVEANPAENKISDKSPIGRALLGGKVGEKITIKLPAGEKTYTIKAIK